MFNLSKLCVAALSLASTFGIANAQVSWEHWVFVYQAVRGAIELNQGTADFPDTLGRFPLAARIVRLAFHDSAGENGVNAQVDFSNADNAGLEPAYNILSDLYAESRGSGDLPVELSKADFFAWAYVAAVQFSVGSARDIPVPDFPVRWGRQNSAPDTEHFLSGHAEGGDVLSYFDTNFGFNAVDATALMGAHSLGGADPANSGFTGVWTPRRSTLDEDYYTRILDNAVAFATCNDFSDPDGSGLNAVCNVDPEPADEATCSVHANGCWNTADGVAFKCDTDDGWRCHGWEQVHNRMTGTYQWKHACGDNPPANCRGLMLNADIGLFINIDGNIDEDGQIETIPGNTECSPGGLSAGRFLAKCFDTFSEQSGVDDEASESSEAIASFDENPVEWILRFANVYERMLFHGNDPDLAGLNLVTESTPEPTASPTVSPTASPTASTTASPTVSPTPSPTGPALTARGESCPSECLEAVENIRGASATCDTCITGICMYRRNTKVCGRPRL